MRTWTTPGAVPRQTALISAVMIAVGIAALDASTRQTLSIQALYLLPLAIIGLHCAWTPTTIASAALSIVFPLGSWLLGESSRTPAQTIIGASAFLTACVLTLKVARIAWRSREDIASEDATRRESERVMQRLAARYEHLVEHASDIIYESDAAGRFVYFNTDTVFRVLHLTPEELLGHHYLELVRPDWRDRVEQFYRAQFYQGIRLTYFEFPVCAKDGTEVWFGQNVQQIVENGRIVGHEAICRDVTERRRQEAALERSREELRELAAHIEDVREQERTRIAREIHDELGGLLTAVQANLTTSLDSMERTGTEQQQQLVLASELVNEAMDSLREVITELRPSVLDHLGVWAAIEWQARRVGKTMGLDCSVDIEPAVSSCEIDAVLGTALFRIVQEGLTNAARHASATRVSIRVGQRDEWVVIELQDNGRGIDEAELSRSNAWGIAGMRERARHFHGELVVAGTAGEGTTITVRVPWRHTTP